MTFNIHNPLNHLDIHHESQHSLNCTEIIHSPSLSALYKTSPIQYAFQHFYLDIHQILKLHTTINASLQENKPIMANHSSIINNHKQSSKNSNMASIQRGESSGFPHALASRPEARERPNAPDDIRAEPSTRGQDMRSPLIQALDQMGEANLVAVYQTLLDNLHPDYARQVIEEAKKDARHTEQSLQAVQPRRRHQVDQNRTDNEAKSNQTPTAKDYRRVQGVMKNDKGGTFVSEMTWGRIPCNEQGQVQHKLNAENRVKDVTDESAKKQSKALTNQQVQVQNRIVTKKGVAHSTSQSAKQTSKASDTKVVGENFQDLPYLAQVKALDKVTSEICSIARHISDASEAGDSKRSKELTAQVGTLTARKKFMETHFKPKGSRDENQQPEKDNRNAPAKKALDVKVVRTNFRDLPYDDQVKLMKRAEMDLRVIAGQMTQTRKRGQFDEWEGLNTQFLALTKRQKFVKTHLKTKDRHHENSHTDKNDILEPSWLGKEGHEDWTTAWLEMKHSKHANTSTPQTENKKESKNVKKEVQKTCSCGGKCQIPLRHPPNPNPEGLTQAERKANDRERRVAEALSELAEDVSQMLIQTPRRLKNQGFEVPDQRLQRTYIVTLSKGKGKGTPPDPRAQGRGAVVSFEDELIDKLRTYSALLWENQESFEVDKRLLGHVKRALEWIEKLRPGLHEGPEDTDKIEAMKEWRWPKDASPPAKASAAPAKTTAKTTARAKPAGN
jgi:hypothetical protein